MIRLIRLLLSFISIVYLHCHAYTQADVQNYIALHKETALQNEKEYGIPATIILAQGILESGAGTSGLTRASNNHFGIKAGSSWTGPVHLAFDDEGPRKSRFRCYRSAAESFRDHTHLLTTYSRYRFLFNISIYDYRGWAHGLKKAGYASAPNYAQALIGIIDEYKLYRINGGVKLKPGKTVTITQYRTVEKPVFEEEIILDENEESEEQAMIEKAMSRHVVQINDIHCTVMQPGETLSMIARRYDIPIDDLLEFNEIATEYQARDGGIIFLGKKKKKYEGPQDEHIASAGETLYDISQEYGIQLHRLARLNDMDDYTDLREGTHILLK